MDKSDCLTRVAELHKAGNTSQAAELCETSLCSGIPDCQRFLGWFYFKQGDLEKAHGWYLKAAAQGDAGALADCWKIILQFDAKGDKRKSAELCETVPCCEFLDCQRYLENFFFVQGNMEKTLHWSLKAAEHGEADDLFLRRYSIPFEE